MPFAVNGDARLWFERAGSGPPLLFINGTGSSLDQRPNILEGPLTERFDLLAYDHRGQGRSTAPDGPWSMADYADDVVAVLDAAGVERCAVFGVSFGGMIAQEVAIRFPDRVGRLVLACTSSGGAGGSSFPLHEIQDLPDDDRARLLLGVNDIRYGAAWQTEHPDETDALVAVIRERGGAPLPRQLQARADHDAFDRLHRIASPTLVAAGEFDGMAPLANSEALVAAIPEATLRVFDGGHVFLLQDRSAFGVIGDFLLG